MKRTKALVLSLGVVAMVVLGGCQSAEPTVSATGGDAEDVPVRVNDMDLLALGTLELEESDDVVTPEPTVSATGGDAEDAPVRVSDMDLLALGILELEESDDAVTPEQASEMLPLWKMLASGGLRGDTESASVTKQIEKTLTASQSATITAMALTSEDQQVWMEEQGIEMPDAGGFAQAGNATDEDRAALREKFQNMSEEERAQARAEMGVEGPQGAGGGLPGDGAGNAGAAGLRGGNAVVQALIGLLTERSAE